MLICVETRWLALKFIEILLYTNVLSTQCWDSPSESYISFKQTGALPGGLSPRVAGRTESPTNQLKPATSSLSWTATKKWQRSLFYIVKKITNVMRHLTIRQRIYAISTYFNEFQSYLNIYQRMSMVFNVFQHFSTYVISTYVSVMCKSFSIIWSTAILYIYIINLY